MKCARGAWGQPCGAMGTGKVKPHGSLRGAQNPVVHPRVHTGATIALVTINDQEDGTEGAQQGCVWHKPVRSCWQTGGRGTIERDLSRLEGRAQTLLS